jgi:hypothetical protein
MNQEHGMGGGADNGGQTYPPGIPLPKEIIFNEVVTRLPQHSVFEYVAVSVIAICVCFSVMEVDYDLRDLVVTLIDESQAFGDVQSVADVDFGERPGT